MRLIVSLLTLLTLALAPATPSHSALTTHTIALTQFAQPAAFTAETQARIIELTTSFDRPFTAAFTLTVVLSGTATITAVTTLPSYVVVTAMPGCVRLAPVLSIDPSIVPLPPGPIRLLCSVTAEADQAVVIPVRFTVPWNVRGEVLLKSLVGGTETIDASFIIPPQPRLPLLVLS